MLTDATIGAKRRRNLLVRNTRTALRGARGTTVLIRRDSDIRQSHLDCAGKV